VKGPALTHDDVAGLGKLPAEYLDAKPFAV
jgi:hypothetical protein